ncbi:MAG: aminotransferase class I/II-fold pyridoxal phosphate-dependent enzyme, partial [Candidatus Aenigmarchaeota archaeon]|nr:aminotransferase class I/II-fold pyridoxal phosphate-dependent enzyme [Candidatus Aenigmarchaeota archaeon]
AVRLPYNVNPVTYAAGLATLEPDSMAYYKTLIELTKSERSRLRGNLESLGFRVRPSQTNFVLAKTESPETAKTLYGELAENKILVRYFSDPRLADCLRITVGMPEENDRLIAKIGELLG